MQDDREKVWIKWLIIALLIGIVVGKVLSVLLGLVLHGGNWDLLTGSMIPLCSLVAVLVVAFLHQKDKEHTIE